MSLIHEHTDTVEIHDLYASFSGALAFDIGANAGQVAAEIAPSFRKVVACEPSEEPYRRLEADCRFNVVALRVAVSDHDGTVTLQRRDMTSRTGYLFTGDSLPEWGGLVCNQNVECRTLDSLTAEYGQPDFVKIDTEGHELHVLEAGVATFTEHPDFLVEIHSEGNGETAAVWLRSLGLTPRVVRHEQHEPGSHNWRNHYWLVSR